MALTTDLTDAVESAIDDSVTDQLTVFAAAIATAFSNLHTFYDPGLASCGYLAELSEEMGMGISSESAPLTTAQVMAVMPSWYATTAKAALDAALAGVAIAVVDETSKTEMDNPA